jgi:hypothetical protein
MNRKFIFAVLIALFVLPAVAIPFWAQTPKVVAVRAGHMFDSKSGQMR